MTRGQHHTTTKTKTAEKPTDMHESLGRDRDTSTPMQPEQGMCRRRAFEAQTCGENEKSPTDEWLLYRETVIVHEFVDLDGVASGL